MKTGTGIPCRHPVVLAAIFAGTLVLPLLLSGCDDHSPVAAPTSTLPAKDSSADPTGDQASPSVPEYKTDLDLSAEEKKAVEGALVAFDGYFKSVNSAYSGHFESIDDFQQYARGDALESIEGDARVIQDGSYEFTGTVNPTRIEITDLKNDDHSHDPNTVIVNFCFDLTEWTLQSKVDSAAPRKSSLVTMEHTITREDDGWRVSEQSLKEDRC